MSPVSCGPSPGSRGTSLGRVDPRAEGHAAPRPRPPKFRAGAAGIEASEAEADDVTAAVADIARDRSRGAYPDLRVALFRGRGAGAERLSLARHDLDPTRLPRPNYSPMRITALAAAFLAVTATAAAPVGKRSVPVLLDRRERLHDGGDHRLSRTAHGHRDHHPGRRDGVPHLGLSQRRSRRVLVDEQRTTETSWTLVFRHQGDRLPDGRAISSNNPTRNGTPTVR
jgi:hypothetical protein